MQELERASHEVELYENYIDRVTSFHKDLICSFDWLNLEKSVPPNPPVKDQERERNARYKLEHYTPSFFGKLFGADKRDIQDLNSRLVSAIEEDEAEYQTEVVKFQRAVEEIQETVEIARNINQGNLEYYKRAIQELGPFSEISELGSNIGFQFPSRQRVIADVNIHDEKVIPRKSKSLLKSGKVSEKEITATRYFELYQDHVCASVIRVARELFGLLPIEEALVTATGEFVNQATGRLDARPVVSVLFLRETCNRINFDLVDPSECLSNFKHNMSFRKTQGFQAVERLEE